MMFSDACSPPGRGCSDSGVAELTPQRSRAVEVGQEGKAYTHVFPAKSLGECVDGNKCIPLHSLHTLYPESPLPLPADTPDSTAFEILRKLCAEFLGTGLLLLIVVGSGIMAQKLSPSDIGLQLLQNAIATGCGLFCLISIFGPVSGAHFNPCVSLVDWLHGDMSLRDLGLYTFSQVAGGILGVVVANLEFDEQVELSRSSRDERHYWLSEVIGTATLLVVIHGCLRTGKSASVPYAVGAWVCGGHFFTSSTIFANPAVTIARMFSDTFAGIEKQSVGPFIGFQIFGTLIAFSFIRFFFPKDQPMKRDDNLYLRICIAAEHC